MKPKATVFRTPRGTETANPGLSVATSKAGGGSILLGTKHGDVVRPQIQSESRGPSHFAKSICLVG